MTRFIRAVEILNYTCKRRVYDHDQDPSKYSRLLVEELSSADFCSLRLEVAASWKTQTLNQDFKSSRAAVNLSQN